MASIVNGGRFGGLTLQFPEGFVGLNQQGQGLFALNLEAATAFFQQIAIKKMDILNDGRGIYSVVGIGRNQKAKFQSLTVPRHLLQSRKDCHIWTPKGKQYFRPEDIPTYAYEYNGEQCADSFFDTCMEKILPQGEMVNDITGTPEGDALFMQMIQNIYVGLGNSFYDIIHFSNDNFMTQSITNNWWQTAGTETVQQWNDFVDQQQATALSGLIPQIEAEKAGGAANFNVSISTSDVSGDEYIGTDVTALLESCRRAAPAEFSQIVNRRQGGFGAAFLVSVGIFNAYEDYIIANYNGITEGYQFLLDGSPVPGVLAYKGIPVIAMDEWHIYDRYLGINTHRVLLTALGNMGIAHNVEPGAARQFDGLGLVAMQRPEISAKGKYEMYTTFRTGATILDTNYMVNASLAIDPDGSKITYSV